MAKKFPAFYGTRRFIIAFTRARQCTLILANELLTFINPVYKILEVYLLKARKIRYGSAKPVLIIEI
jgi:hypothetical protein